MLSSASSSARSPQALSDPSVSATTPQDSSSRSASDQLPPVADAVGDGDRLLGGVGSDLVDQRGDEDLLAHAGREQRAAGQR